MREITRELPALCVRLDQYRLIEIVGVDAEKYLQGQLTCDVAKLAIGGQTLTAHCDPKGKMSALFRLFRAGEQQFFAIVLRDLLPEALIQLKKYAVFSKVAFNECENVLFGTTSGDIIAKIRNQPTACIIEGEPQRAIFWGTAPDQSDGDSQLWHLLDIQQGIPLLFKPNQFELIPQVVNLQCLEQAISFTKGCYIGQETVARAKYRGMNKRAMFTLVGNTNNADLPPIGESLELQMGEHWKATGTVLSATLDQQQLWVQIVLNKDTPADSRFRFGDTTLHIVPLPYSLDDNE